MRFSLSLIAIFAGFAALVAGFTNRKLTDLLRGQWSPTGETAQPAVGSSAGGAHAANGGTFAPSGRIATGVTV